MSENPTKPNEILDEELIAYLDGELPADEARQLERRLASEATLRNRLHELERTWEMLELLPKSQPTRAFTASTLSMVALTVEQDIQKVERRTNWSTVAWWLGGAVAAVAASLAAFLTTHSQLEQPNRELARDLPVIEHLDEYRYVDNLDFLQRLDQEGLFVTEEGDALPGMEFSGRRG